MNEATIEIARVFLYAFVLIISVLLVIAVLKIPRLVRYQRAQFKLQVQMAKRAGVTSDELEPIILEAENAENSADDPKHIVGQYKIY